MFINNTVNRDYDVIHATYTYTLMVSSSVNEESGEVECKQYSVLINITESKFISNYGASYTFRIQL